MFFILIVNISSYYMVMKKDTKKKPKKKPILKKKGKKIQSQSQSQSVIVNVNTRQPRKTTKTPSKTPKFLDIINTYPIFRELPTQVSMFSNPEPVLPSVVPPLIPKIEYYDRQDLSDSSNSEFKNMILNVGKTPLIKPQGRPPKIITEEEMLNKRYLKNDLSDSSNSEFKNMILNVGKTPLIKPRGRPPKIITEEEMLNKRSLKNERKRLQYRLKKQVPENIDMDSQPY